jgi:hypothetical protein
MVLKLAIVYFKYYFLFYIYIQEWNQVLSNHIIRSITRMKSCVAICHVLELFWVYILLKEDL